MVELQRECSRECKNEGPSWASFGLFQVQNGCDMDEVVAHMCRVCSRIEKSSNGCLSIALLRSLDQPVLGVFVVWTGPAGSRPNFPEASAFTRGMNLKYSIKIVESGWFELGCREINKDHASCARISLGDIVSVRRMLTGGISERQKLLSYCCLAVLKSYFDRLKGVHSYSFYESMNGLQILGIAVWDNVESASALAKSHDCNPAITFWKALGAKKLSLDIFQVVYVTHDSPFLSIYDNGCPGFRF